MEFDSNGKLLSMVWKEIEEINPKLIMIAKKSDIDNGGVKYINSTSVYAMCNAGNGNGEMQGFTTVSSIVFNNGRKSIPFCSATCAVALAYDVDELYDLEFITRGVVNLIEAGYAAGKTSEKTCCTEESQPQPMEGKPAKKEK